MKALLICASCPFSGTRYAKGPDFHRHGHCLPISLLFAAVILIAIMPHRLNAQVPCSLDIGYDVEVGLPGTASRIYLTLNEGEGPFTFRLYDLNSGGSEFLQTREYASMNQGSRELVFRDIPPGHYLIRAESPKCMRSLSGMEAIVIR